MIFICFTIVDLPLSPDPVCTPVSKNSIHVLRGYNTQEQDLAFLPQPSRVLFEFGINRSTSFPLFHLVGTLRTHTSTHLAGSEPQFADCMFVDPPLARCRPLSVLLCPTPNKIFCSRHDRSALAALRFRVPYSRIEGCSATMADRALDLTCAHDSLTIATAHSRLVLRAEDREGNRTERWFVV